MASVASRTEMRSPIKLKTVGCEGVFALSVLVTVMSLFNGGSWQLPAPVGYSYPTNQQDLDLVTQRADIFLAVPAAPREEYIVSSGSHSEP